MVTIACYYIAPSHVVDAYDPLVPSSYNGMLCIGYVDEIAGRRVRSVFGRPMSTEIVDCEPDELRLVGTHVLVRG